MKRQSFATIFVAVVLFALLASAIAFMVAAWQRTDAQMSIHGWIALALGVFFSLFIGCGLMALMFYSSRHGYDEQPRHSDFNEGTDSASPKEPE